MTAFDPRPPEFYAAGPPLQQEDGTIAVTRHADLDAAVRAERGGHLTAAHPAIAAGLAAAGVPVDRDGLHIVYYFAWGQDQDGHARMMKVLAPWLAGRAVSRLGAVAGRAARELRPGGRELDAVAFARDLATRVTEELTGIAAAHAELLLQEAEALARREGLEVFMREPAEVTRQLGRLVREARGGDGLAAAAVAAHDQGKLTERELHAVIFGVWAAARETTAAATTAMFVYLSSCAGHPGSQDPRWRAAVIEETLRLACPFTRTTLITRGGVQLAGLDIPAGTALELRWAAGNRDPAVFGADAGEFVPGRDGGAKHWAFGRGVHACAGAAMARLVMDAALAAVSVDGAELASVKVGTGMVDGPTEAVLLLPAAGC